MKISKSEIRYLREHLPYLENVLLKDDSSNYSEVAISIFDHWLSMEEQDQIFISDQTETVSRRNKFEEFVRRIFGETSVYSFKLKKKEKLFFKKSSMTNSFIKRSGFAIMTEDGGNCYSLLLPELSAIYLSGYDWTDRLLFTDRSKVENLISIVEPCGLNAIEKE